MNGLIRQTTLIMVFAIAIIILAAKSVQAADMFMDVAANPAFLRDVHVVSISGSRINNANTSDGQRTGISYDQLGVGVNIWNNERNQVLGGIQYGRREFDRNLSLPDGFIMPERVDNVSVAVAYKHITLGDWSFNQAIRYTGYRTYTPSVSVRDTFDLVGLAAISREPGVTWAFGYYFDQTTDTKNHLYPVIEYANTRYDRWTFTVGYPVLSFSFSPHPDWMFGGGGISYKVTEQNIARLSYAGDNWAYRLEGSDGKAVAYTAQRLGFDWTYLYYIDHRTVVILNAALGWELNRKFGSDNKLSMGNAAVMGLNASLSF